MNIQHFEKGVQYSERELLLMAKKLGKMATYCEKIKDEASIIRVEAERRPTKKDRDQVKVMITVKLPKGEMRAESRRKQVIDALDRCIEKLEKPLKKYKEMHTGRQLAHRSMRKRRAA